MKWRAKGIQILRGSGGPVLVVPAPHTEDLNNIRIDREYSIEIKTEKKRSLNANAYCWVLCQRIAEVLSRDGQYISKEEVYRHAVQDSQQPNPICVQKKIADRVRKSWEHNGLGWIAIDAGSSKIKDCTVLFCYAGSSVYDTREMSRLIDCLVDMAHEQGIATEDDQYIDSLVKEWEAENE